MEFDTIGCRRTQVLIRGLPADAASRRGEERWTWQDELAALQIEVVDGWARAFAKLQGARLRGAPIQIPRPAAAMAARRKKPTTDGAEMAAFFGKWFSAN